MIISWPTFKILPQKSYISLPDNTSRPLKSSNTQSALNYKRHFRTYIDKRKIVKQATELQEKLTNKIISPNDHNTINKLDILLTTEMIKAEQMITKYDTQFPWSPILAKVVLNLSIWKLIKSESKTKTSRASKLQQLTSRLYKLDNNYPK